MGKVQKQKKKTVLVTSDLEPTVAMWMKRNKPNILNVHEMKIEKTE